MGSDVADECIFCKIRDDQIPTKKIFDDAQCFAFEDINPQAPTHVLICPRDHIPSLLETEEKHESTLGHLATVAAKIAKKRGLSSFRTVVNTGPGAGQSVFHIHLHLLGGRTLTWPPG